VQKPLAEPIRDRVERTQSYQRAQTDMGKWTGQIKQNREADCVDFTPDVNLVPNLSSVATSRAGAAAQTPLEQEVQQALQKQGIGSDEQIKVAEGLTGSRRRSKRCST
jgi:U3 small nucleolar RNA-associated protein 14